MKPGPATSAFSIKSSARSFVGDPFGEIARLWPASFASTIAALVAMSPWVGIARRLDHDRATDRGRPAARLFDERGCRPRARAQALSEKMLRWAGIGHVSAI